MIISKIYLTKQALDMFKATVTGKASCCLIGAGYQEYHEGAEENRPPELVQIEVSCGVPLIMFPDILFASPKNMCAPDVDIEDFKIMQDLQTEDLHLYSDHFDIEITEYFQLI